jgi:nitroreductase
MTTTHSAIDAAIESRMSVRAFLPRPVAKSDIESILQGARVSTPGLNTKPWKVYVLQGASRDALVEKVSAAHRAIYADPLVAAQYPEEYPYYPEKWFSPYIDRRRENGWGLYGLLGIVKGEKDKMHAQHARNYRFFDAPVGLMFTVNRAAGLASLTDYGVFLQNVMLAARQHELSTCPQAAWNGFANIILPHVGAAANEMLVCGMSLGYADDSHVVNSFHTPREAVESFTRWLD